MNYTLCPIAFLADTSVSYEAKHVWVCIFSKFAYSYSKACLKSKVSSILSFSLTNLRKAIRCPKQRWLNSVFHNFVSSNFLVIFLIPALEQHTAKLFRDAFTVFFLILTERIGRILKISLYQSAQKITLFWVTSIPDSG